MGHTKRHDQRSTSKHSYSTTTTTKGRAKTRSDKPKLIQDPGQEEKVLTQQLRESGLYAANILGDGNCLFRALSDQLFGSPSQHFQLREEICKHLRDESERYRLFVDEDDYKGGWTGYVREMNQPGTYGTNIELSAFVHLYQRPLKVFQPGLVYVMQPEPSTSASKPPPSTTPADGNTTLGLSAREKRAKAREAKTKGSGKGKEREKEKVNGKGKGKERATEEEEQTEEDEAQRSNRTREEVEEGPLCIVYHSWEHYSSLRNLKGPHTGPPRLKIARPVSPSLVEHPSASTSKSPSPPPPPLPKEPEPDDVEMTTIPTDPPPPAPPPRTSRPSPLEHCRTKPESVSKGRRRSSRLSGNHEETPSVSKLPSTDPKRTKRARPSRLIDSNLVGEGDDPGEAEFEGVDEEDRRKLQYRGDSPALTNSSSTTTTTTSTATTDSSTMRGGEGVDTRGNSTRSGSTTSLDATHADHKERELEEGGEEESEENNSDQDVESILLRPSFRSGKKRSSPTVHLNRPSPSPPSSRSPLPVPSPVTSSPPPPAVTSEPSSSVSPEKRGKTRRDRAGVMTSREKQEMNRVRRMERRKDKTAATVNREKEGDGRILRNGKKTGASANMTKGGRGGKEDSVVTTRLGGQVRELYI
ncbi:hypothetical protein JCM16303_002860 [Sporobolomyces ruberrimus]